VDRDDPDARLAGCGYIAGRDRLQREDRHREFRFRYRKDRGGLTRPDWPNDYARWDDELPRATMQIQSGNPCAVEATASLGRFLKPASD